jgi:hypothetical protein
MISTTSPIPADASMQHLHQKVKREKMKNSLETFTSQK